MEVPKKKKTFNPISSDSIKKLTHSKSVNTDLNIKKMYLFQKMQNYQNVF